MIDSNLFSQPVFAVLPPVLKFNSHGWYIEYYELNPIVHIQERKRIRLNQLRGACKSKAEFMIKANDIMMTITNRLRMAAQVNSSFNNAVMTASAPSMLSTPPAPAAVAIPAPTHENIRFYMNVAEVIDIFLKEKDKDLRDSSVRSYKSGCKMLKTWLNKKYPTIQMAQFTKPIAIQFMDEIAEKEIGPRTYNNVMRIVSSFMGWAVKKCYARENVFIGMERKRTHAKKRTIIPADAQRLIDNYFKIHNPAMRIVMRMVYTSLLRPIEISRVQVNQIDFERHCIHMTGDKTKNWDDRDARMDSELEDLLRKHIIGANPDDYLFADRQWKCGKKSQGSHSYSKAWEDMRRGLVDANGNQIIPEEYQLYSLKDTSINGMIKSGVDDLSVMQTAGHKDLKMTRIYADHVDSSLIDDLNASAPKFGQAVVKPSLKQAMKDSDNKLLS